MNHRDIYTTYLGKESALTGASAIEIIESALCEGVSSLRSGVVRNIFGRPVIVQQHHSEGVAFAMGLSSSGLRTNTIVYGTNVLQEEKALSESVRRHLAYVIHVYTQDQNQLGLSQDADHRHFHAASDLGCIQFFASNVQEAVDLTILAHKASELCLCPVMVAMDQATSSAEQCIMPDQNLLKEFLGQGDDFIDSPTPAQKMIFGKLRRRIPNWFHFDFPAIQGMNKTGQAQSFELAAQQAYFGSHAETVVEQLFKDYEKLTGRAYSPISSYKTEDAEHLILVQGSSYQRVVSVVDHFRSKKIKAGAIHIRMVRPFPGKELCELLSGKKALTILERMSQPLDSDPPIFRDAVSALDKAAQNSGKKKNPVYLSFPAMNERERPVLYSGQYGTSDDSLTYEDVVRVFENMISGGQRRFFVDIEFSRATSSYPKQQILLQNINRDYPEIERLTLAGVKPTTISTDQTFSMRWDIAITDDAPGAQLEKIAEVISRRWNCRTKAKKVNEQTCQLNITRQAWPYPIDKDDEVDALITDVAGLRTLYSLQNLKKEALIVIISSAENEVIPLPQSAVEHIRKMNFRLFLISKTTELDPLILGCASALTAAFFKEKLDPAKEVLGIEKILNEKIGFDLSDAQRTALLQGLTEMVEIKDLSILPAEEPESAELALALRKYEDHGPPYSRVSQFYDRTGIFYETGAAEEMVADPFQALQMVPASTANFIRNGNTRETAPEFIPSKCTGCGQCSVYCPESAIPPIVISAESFIRSAVDQAQANGISMTQWTPPVVKNFAKLINQALLVFPENMVTPGDLLPDILKKLAAQMKMEGERLQTLTEEFNALTPVLNHFPVAVTKTFFSDPERQMKGSGSLFSVAVNPQSCTGCGICADVCPDNALVMSIPDHERIAKLQTHFRLWEQLPDTPADIIQKMVQDKTYDPFAAILLSRNYYMSMVGGFGSAKGSPEKMMTHLVASAAESVTQSNTNKQIDEIGKRIKMLSEKIQNKLREALPTDNFDNLMNSLSGSENSRISLDTVITKLSETQRFGVVETAWIERIVLLINELKTLTWALSKGPSGVGRSRFGAVLAGSDTLDWAKQFPYNAFASPVVIYDDPDSMNFILGLCHGHIRQMIDNIKLLRRADLEVQNQYDPIIHDEQIANLSWAELADSEKTFIPPLFVLTDHKMLSKINIPSLLRLLSSDFPIKVILFDSASGNADYWRARMAVTTAVVSSQRTFFLQSSMAKADHLFKGLMDGLQHSKPGFFHILTPSPEVSQEMDRLAIITRAFPLLRFAPTAQKHTFSEAFDLSANPEPYEEYITTHYKQGDQTVKYFMTLADWLFLQPEFKKHFTLIDEQERRGIAVSEYIAMTRDARTDKIPFIVSAIEENRMDRYAVSETIIKAAEAAYLSWNMLREMAGMLAPYPLKLKERLDEEWSVKQTAALEQLKSDYEEKLQQQESTQLEQIKKKLSDKLMALSGYGNKF